jgi:hypothetical protein
LSDLARFTIVGEGCDRSNLENLARSLGIEKAVSFCGWLCHAEVLMRVRSADVMVFPSLRDNGADSNGSRLHAWKRHLRDLADRLRMTVTVCHYPPGTSKWNKVEYRLFSFISMSRRGRPLLSYEAVVNLIGATTTKSGLWVKALLDTREYGRGRKITDDEMRTLRLKRHEFYGDWNYTIQPRLS